MASLSYREKAFIVALAAAVAASTGLVARADAACATAPRADCVPPFAASLVIKESNVGRERLKLALRSIAEDVERAILGDPVGSTTSYDLCLYDDAGALAGGLTIDRGGQTCAGKPCWIEVSDSGYRYRDTEAAADGVQKMLLDSGRAGRGKLSLRAGNRAGKGQTAMPTGLAAALAGTGSATAQFVASDGGCYGAVLTRVVRAEAASFSASGSLLSSAPTVPVTTTSTSTTRPSSTTIRPTTTSTSTSRPTTTSTSTSRPTTTSTSTSRPSTTSTSTSTSRPTTTSTSTSRPTTTSTSTSTSRPTTTSTSTSRPTTTSTSTSRPTTTSTSTSRPPTTTSTSTSTSTSSTTVTTTTGAATTTTSTTVPASTTWARRFGAATGDLGNAVVTDAAGNVVVGGAFRGSVTLGGTTLNSAGAGDGFVAKYSSAGTLLWARAVGGTGDDSVSGVAVDPNGDVAVTGRLGASVNLGGGLLAVSGSSDVLLAKYAGASGAHLWSKRFGGIYDDGGAGVGVDGTGAIVITGHFRGTADFGTGPLTVPFSSDLDVFVAKFAGTGAALWAKNFPNTGNDRGYGVAVTTAGEVAVAGTFSNTIDFGGDTLASANGMIDAFVAKLAANGAHLWSRQIGTPDSNEGAGAVAMDAGGNVIVTGYTVGALNLGGGSLAPLGGTDAYVAKYAATSGAHAWSRRVGGAGDEFGYGLAVDGTGNVVVTGVFEGTAAFGGASLTATGDRDGFVAKYGPAGAPVWARKLGGASADLSLAAAFAPTANVITTGWFNDTGTFGSTTLTSAGGADVFVARLVP